MDKLTGPQIGQLRDLLAEVFNSLSFRQLLRIKLEIQFDVEYNASGLPFKDALFEFIEDMERKGRIASLMQAAREERAENADFNERLDTILANTNTATSAPVHKTDIPHNLPTLQPFFGREDELKKIADALDPDSRTWGALIDGPGGMGKTSLAVRAAYDASPEVFKKIIFVSLKTRELDDDGLRDLSGFLISGLAELLNELARELGCDDIAKAPEDQRPRLLLDKLRGTQTLLVLDNLESLLKRERDTLFTFVKKLPAGCRAILTSRERFGNGTEELTIKELSEQDALDTLAELATHNSHVAQTSEAERLVLYRETGGKPLLLRWTAGQLGRGHCLTFTDALHFIRSCPEGNDPLEFIFGDLVADLDAVETQALCALTYFTLPAKVEHVAAIAGLSELDTERALRKLSGRSLAVPTDELKTFTLVPMVAAFLSKKRPQMIEECGRLLDQLAHDHIYKYGLHNHVHFEELEKSWPIIVAALPLFLAGDNHRLQKLCNALRQFCRFMGYWDAWLSLSTKAEEKAAKEKDFREAGWRAFQVGQVHRLRRNAAAVHKAAANAKRYWDQHNTPLEREQGCVEALYGRGYYLEGNYSESIARFTNALRILEEAKPREDGKAVLFNIASTLNGLGDALRHSAQKDKSTEDRAAAKLNFSKARDLAQSIHSPETQAAASSSLAQIALDCKDWVEAEKLALEAMPLAEQIHCKELIAKNRQRLAEALLGQGKAAEAGIHAQTAAAIFSQLGSHYLKGAEATLIACQIAIQSDGTSTSFSINALLGGE